MGTKSFVRSAFATAREQSKKDYASTTEKYKKDCEALKKKHEDEYTGYTGLINLANKIIAGDLSSYAYMVFKKSQGMGLRNLNFRVVP